MKTLQNDFTTPEQSKRLLELGLPQDSANMILDGYVDSANRWVPDLYPRYLEHPYSVEIKNESKLYTSNVLPCWSVGRLIEIYDICFIYPKSRNSWCAHTRVKGVLFVNYILDCYKNAIADKLLDFSKLED